MAIRIVGFLAQNAVIEKRFNDAAQYYFMMATEYLSLVEKPDSPSASDYKNIKSYEENSLKSEIYLAYQNVFQLIENPYHNIVHGSLTNETIFNAARFLSNTFKTVYTEGVNKVYVYYALAFMAAKFEAFKTARYGYDKLQGLKIPVEWQEEIDV